MNHQKDDVLPVAQPLWPEILQALTSIDSKFFNGKNQACPLCGGKDRARFIRKHELQFHCNQCGDKSGLQFYMEMTGIGFSDAINDVGNWLNLIPQDRRVEIQREHEVLVNFPDWYKFDMKHYLKLKESAKPLNTSWQRVNGLSMIDILSDGENALIPLSDSNGKPVDFLIVDIDSNYQSTGGNTIIPRGFYSTFGDSIGKRTYLTVSPLVAAHASIFTGKQIICVWDEENIWEVGKNCDDPPVVIVSNLSETMESDALKFNQLIFNKKNNTVNRRLYKYGEIIKERENK